MNHNASDGGGAGHCRQANRITGRIRLRKVVWLAALTAIVGSTGCNLLTPLVFIAQPRQRIPAEFDKLAGSRTAVLIWTEMATQFDFPHIRHELMTYTSDRLSLEFQNRQRKIELIPATELEDYLGSRPAARGDPRAVAARFKTDYVIYVELLEFQVRDPSHPQLLAGKVHASVAVYDFTAGADNVQRYELAPEQFSFPETGALPLSPQNALYVREGLYRIFAERIVRKFHEYSIEVK